MSEIIYGIHAIHTLLEIDPRRFIGVFVIQKYSDVHRNRRLHHLVKHLQNAGIFVCTTNHRWFNKVLDKKKAHSGVIAIVQPNKTLHEEDLLLILKKQLTPLILVLDSITDPHNLGACLRCADAAGVHAIIINRNRTAALNAVAKKVASGAAETIPLIRVTNLVRTLRLLQSNNIWVIGTTDKAERHIYQSKLTGPIALVLGAENTGMRYLTSKCCDELIRIPMAGKVPSLNISVAAGVCLFEAVRQRRQVLS